jgi:cytochrome P450
MADLAPSERLARPAHVPDAAFYDFDMFSDAALLKNPHGRILELLENAPPVFWTPRNGGHWMLLSHRANFEAARDTATFSSEVVPREIVNQFMASLPPGTPRIPQPRPISLDPPQHSAYRGPLQGAFSPKTMLALKDSIRALAAELIKKIKPLGRANFLAEVAEPMPVQVFLKMFGLPVERQAEYRELVKEQLAALNRSGQADMPLRLQKVAAVMRDTLIERKNSPRDDLISLLWRSEIDGRATTMEEMEDYCVVLFIAGLDTVMNGIGHGVLHLATHPELQRELRANPKMITKAAEEMLRRYTFTVPPRRVAKDTVFQGVTMKAHDRAMLFLPAADLDRSVHSDPDRYEIDRESVHIAFGVGPHRCLGSHLARIELQVLYEELLAGLPEFRLDRSQPLSYHGGHVIGPDAVWLKWDVA